MTMTADPAAALLAADRAAALRRYRELLDNQTPETARELLTVMETLHKSPDAKNADAQALQTVRDAESRPPDGAEVRRLEQERDEKAAAALAEARALLHGRIDELGGPDLRWVARLPAMAPVSRPVKAALDRIGFAKLDLDNAMQEDRELRARIEITRRQHPDAFTD